MPSPLAASPARPARWYDAAAVATHPRFRALGTHTQPIYLRLLASADATGWVETALVRRFRNLLPHGPVAINALIDAELLTLPDDDGPGFRVVLPEALDAAMFETVDQGDSPFDGAATRAQWRADFYAELAAEFGDRFRR